MMIIITNFRPIKCSKGYFRAEIRHGISGVHNGERHTYCFEGWMNEKELDDLKSILNLKYTKR